MMVNKHHPELGIEDNHLQPSWDTYSMKQFNTIEIYPQLSYKI